MREGAYIIGLNDLIVQELLNYNSSFFNWYYKYI